MFKVKWLNKQSITQAVYPILFTAHLFVILSIKELTDQSRRPDTAAKWINAHTIAQWPTACCYVL